MQEKIDEIVRNYFEDALYDIEPVPYGLTNITKFLTINNQKYVIRIYNRHTKVVDSIKFEAQITSFLSMQSLSFIVPEFVTTKDGKQYVQLSDGTLGAIVSFVKGTVPDISTIQQAMLHPLADYHAVSAFIKDPPFEIPQTALNFYKRWSSSWSKTNLNYWNYRPALFWKKYRTELQLHPESISYQK